MANNTCTDSVTSQILNITQTPKENFSKCTLISVLFIMIEVEIVLCTVIFYYSITRTVCCNFICTHNFKLQSTSLILIHIIIIVFSVSM